MPDRRLGNQMPFIASCSQTFQFSKFHISKPGGVLTWIMNGKGVKIALIQLSVGSNKMENISKAEQLIRTAAENGASIIALPECFNSPYGTTFFAQYAEKIPGESTDMLSSLAKELKVFIVGGSIPEEDGGKYFNTCTTFSPNGEMVAKHRKVHLVEVEVPGYKNFETEVLCPGNSLTTFETPYCKVGLGICYDMRFPEMSQVYAKQGCKLLFFPSAFGMTTGPIHWEILVRSRALDNQVFVAGAAPARNEETSFVAWGHSMVASPMCTCGNCDHSLLVGSREFRCCKEIVETSGKFTFEGLEVGCILSHVDFNPLTNRTVLLQVGPLLKAKSGKRYKQYGHTENEGDVIAQCQHQEEIVYADIDFGFVERARSQMPINLQKRSDLYSVENSNVQRT